MHRKGAGLRPGDLFLRLGNARRKGVFSYRFSGTPLSSVNASSLAVEINTDAPGLIQAWCAGAPAFHDRGSTHKAKRSRCRPDTDPI